MNQYAFYFHVDDGLFLGGGQTSGGTDLLVEATANGLQETGFMVKNRTRAHEMKKSLGYEIHGALGRVSYPLDRAHPHTGVLALDVFAGGCLHTCLG